VCYLAALWFMFFVNFVPYSRSYYFTCYFIVIKTLAKFIYGKLYMQRCVVNDVIVINNLLAATVSFFHFQQKLYCKYDLLYMVIKL